MVFMTQTVIVKTRKVIILPQYCLYYHSTTNQYLSSINTFSGRAGQLGDRTMHDGHRSIFFLQGSFVKVYFMNNIFRSGMKGECIVIYIPNEEISFSRF